MLLENTIHLGDCLELMKEIPDDSVNMILCDLPYGTTQNKWDSVLPLPDLWAHYKRIIKNNGAIVLTGQGVFTAKVILSSDIYKYSLIWEKARPGGFLNAKRMPLQAHEDIAVFYKSLPTYNPQMSSGKPYKKKHVNNGESDSYGKMGRIGTETISDGTRYPRSVIKIVNDNHKSLHPTQKPVALFEYLIKTYTNPDDLVLDNCAGSGTTAVACKQTGRRYLCIEKDREYWLKACERVNQSNGII